MWSWLLVLTCCVLYSYGGMAMTALEAYKKRLAIQTLRPSAGMKLNHQELRREKDLFVRYPAWLKNRDRTKNDEKQSLYSLVRAFCHTEVEGGCSWQEANKLLYEFRQPHDGMKMDMIKEWVLPTAVLKQSTPTELNSKCKELTSFPSSLEFIRDYVSKSVPFVVKGGLTEHWAAVRKWDLEYLNRTVGKEDVKLYISLDGDFEKVQTYREWEENIHDLVEVMAPDGSSSKHTGNTSSSSAAAMTDPDFDPEERLLIRPAETVFTFAEFVYLSLFYPNKEQASFYLQKHDLRLWKDFTGLMQDISPFLFGERAGSTAPNKTKVKTMSKSKKIKSDKSKGKTGKRGAVPTAGDDVELSSVSSVDATETIDIEANGFGFSHFLQLQYFLFWAGVGTNRGPVHFDENENLFAMVKGKKTWIMFHPSESKQMYELNAEFRSAHLLFEIDLTKTDIGGGSGSNSKTIRGGRADSVIPSSAAVSAAPVGEYFSLPVSSTEKSFQPFSPVNVTHPDYTIHPLFQQAHRVTCEIEAGDVLYLPSNWWHEVASEGDAGDGLSIGINNFFHPYWKKGSDFIHFSRTEHYDHLNEYIRFTDQQAEIAAKNYINIDKLGIMYEYDEEGLEDALDSDYWRPTVVKSRQTGQRDTQDTQQHHRRQSESEGAYLTYDGGDSSSETTKMKAKSIDLLSRKQKRKNTKKERKAQRAARRRRTRQRRQDEL